MKLIKMSRKKIYVISVLLTVLVFSSAFSAQAVVDGIVSNIDYYDYAVVTGTVTKDIPYIESIFREDYGVDSTFTLPYSLQSGEVYDYDSSASYRGYGNVSVNPAEIINSKYNSSGLLDPLGWTETDADSVMSIYTDVSTNDVANAPTAMRLYITKSSASSSYTLLSQTIASPIPTSKYFNLGIYVLQDGLNLTTGMFAVTLRDTNSKTFCVAMQEGYTDWGVTGSGTTEYLQADYDAGDVLYVQMQLSEWDTWDARNTMVSISTIEIRFNSGDAIWAAGSCAIDIFALSFTDIPIKFGLDRQDQVTSANDYVAMNVSDFSSADLSVRTFDTYVSNIVNADIDFFYVPEREETFTKSSLTAEFEWEVNVDTEVEWVDELSFGTMTLYYVMASTKASYTKFAYGGTDYIDYLENEEAGDAISLGTVSIDTIYLLDVNRIYSDAEWSVAYDDSSVFDGFGAFFTQDWVEYALYGVAGVLLLSAVIYFIIPKKKKK